MFARRVCRRACFVLALTALTLAHVPAHAEDILRKEEILKLLNRNVKAMQIDTSELRDTTQRSSNTPEPQFKAELRKLIPTLPSADVNIDFDYKSSGLKAQAEPALKELGQALADPNMQKFRYVVVGHTDAAEGRDDDQPLSEDRAAAVRDYLVKNYGVSPERIVSIGFGKGRPKEPSNPLSPVNRRVEIINIGEPP